MAVREREPPRPGAVEVEAPAPLTRREARVSPFPDGAAKHWILSSIVWLTVVDLFGLVLATEFVTPEAFGGYSWLSFSRVRPSHVNGVILAWLTMMYFGALFYMLPRLVGTRGMWSERLGIVCAWAWNAMYLLGIIGLLTGHSQGREYGEFIWPIDIALIVIWSLNIINILATVARMFTTFADQMTRRAMSIGQMNSPYSRPWLCPVRRPTIARTNIRFHAHAHHTPSLSLHIPRVPIRRGSM